MWLVLFYSNLPNSWARNIRKKKSKNYGKTQNKTDRRLNRVQFWIVPPFPLHRDLEQIAYRILREKIKWHRRWEGGKSNTYLKQQKAEIPQGIEKNCLKTSIFRKKRQLISHMFWGIKITLLDWGKGEVFGKQTKSPSCSFRWNLPV